MMEMFRCLLQLPCAYSTRKVRGTANGGMRPQRSDYHLFPKVLSNSFKSSHRVAITRSSCTTTTHVDARRGAPSVADAVRDDEFFATER